MEPTTRTSFDHFPITTHRTSSTDSSSETLFNKTTSEMFTVYRSDYFDRNFEYPPGLNDDEKELMHLVFALYNYGRRLRDVGNTQPKIEAFEAASRDVRNFEKAYFKTESTIVKSEPKVVENKEPTCVKAIKDFLDLKVLLAFEKLENMPAWEFVKENKDRLKKILDGYAPDLTFLYTQLNEVSKFHGKSKRQSSKIESKLFVQLIEGLKSVQGIIEFYTSALEDFCQEIANIPVLQLQAKQSKNPLINEIVSIIEQNPNYTSTLLPSNLIVKYLKEYMGKIRDLWQKNRSELKETLKGQLKELAAFADFEKKLMSKIFVTQLPTDVIVGFQQARISLFEKDKKITLGEEASERYQTFLERFSLFLFEEKEIFSSFVIKILEKKLDVTVNNPTILKTMHDRYPTYSSFFQLDPKSLEEIQAKFNPKFGNIGAYFGFCHHILKNNLLSFIMSEMLTTRFSLFEPKIKLDDVIEYQESKKIKDIRISFDKGIVTIFYKQKNYLLLKEEKKKIKITQTASIVYDPKTFPVKIDDYKVEWNCPKELKNNGFINKLIFDLRLLFETMNFKNKLTTIYE